MKPLIRSNCQGNIDHWFNSAESYFLIGQGLGDTMKSLLQRRIKENRK